jgi:hypothetical protein
MNAQAEFPSFIDEAKKRVDGLLKWRPQIESALGRNDAYLTYNEVCQRVMAGNMHWFSSDSAFVIGEVITLQRGPYFHVTIAGGKFEGIKQIENEQVIPLLQSAGITRMTMLARNGFTRRNMPGWKPTKQQYFVKEI